MLVYIIILLISYIIGNISCSYLISKYIFGVDIRTQGSKNAGTTNALRTFGIKAGIITLIGDYFKGTIAVLLSAFIASKLNIDVSLAKYISIIAVVCGHNWPIFLKFRGGKGVATTYGGMLAIAPLPTLACMIFFTVLVLVTRYVSLGSILGVCLFPILMFMENDYGGAWVCILLSISVIYKHKQNIIRIAKGEENRLNFRKKDSRKNKN